LLFYEWVSYAEKNGGIKVSNRYEIESLRQQGVKV
jgi:hypothetical protein